MNGTRIYNTDEVTRKPIQLVENGLLEMYILKAISGDLNNLPDGTYFLDMYNIIIDKNGKIVYYEYRGLKPDDDRTTEPPDDIKKAIDKKIDPLMSEAADFDPGKVNGIAVITRSAVMLNMFKIQVKNHISAIIRDY